jgi:hypothetical protein
VYVKDALNAKATSKIVTYQDLLKCIVISLKYYLDENQKMFLMPLPGKLDSGCIAKVYFLING